MKRYCFDLEALAGKFLNGDIRNLSALGFSLIQDCPHVYDFVLMDCADCDETNLACEI